MSEAPHQRTVDYFFTMLSPWAYIGHGPFTAIRGRHGVAVRYHPVDLSTVFPASGGLPLAKRHPLRQSYRMMELQRWRDRRGLSFHLRPRFWPFDVGLADRTVVALAAMGEDPEGFLPAAFAAVWEGERDLADRTEIAQLLHAGGYDADRVLASADSEPVRATYARSAPEALESGVFGSPSYLLEGEVFWGQDRLDLLEDALTSGRRPFTA